MFSTRALSWSAGLILLAGAVGWQIYARVTAPAMAPGRRQKAAVTVELADVRIGTIRDVGRFTGTLYPREQFTVSPKVAGKLRKILVHFGDKVERGQLIAILDDDELAQSVLEMRASLEVAKAGLLERKTAMDAAERELKRIRKLRARKVASESELDATQADFQAKQALFKVAQARVDQQAASVRAAEIRRGYARIHATWEAKDTPRVVGERFVDEGALLAPNAPIISVIEIRRLNGIINVIERDYPRVRIGQTALITTDAYPGRTFPGRIVRIAPFLRVSSRQARVDIEIDNPDEALRPGMFFRAEIEFGSRDNTRLIPRDAVVRRNGKRGVFLANKELSAARFVPVRFGIVQDDWIEALEPELPGKIVTLGHHLLEDDSPIRLPEPRRGPPAAEKRP